MFNNKAQIKFLCLIKKKKKEMTLVEGQGWVVFNLLSKVLKPLKVHEAPVATIWWYIVVFLQIVLSS